MTRCTPATALGAEMKTLASFKSNVLAMTEVNGKLLVLTEDGPWIVYPSGWKRRVK